MIDYDKRVEEIRKGLESGKLYAARCPECGGTKKKSAWCKEQKVWTLQECKFCGGSGLREPIGVLLAAYDSKCKELEEQKRFLGRLIVSKCPDGEGG